MITLAPRLKRPSLACCCCSLYRRRSGDRFGRQLESDDWRRRGRPGLESRRRSACGSEREATTGSCTVLTKASLLYSHTGSWLESSVKHESSTVWSASATSPVFSYKRVFIALKNLPAEWPSGVRVSPGRGSRYMTMRGSQQKRGELKTIADPAPSSESETIVVTRTGNNVHRWTFLVPLAPSG